MKNYIFYTNDGSAQDLSGDEVENCQILGWANGINPDDAFKNLKKENDFGNMNFDEVLCQELLPEKVYSFSFKF